MYIYKGNDLDKKKDSTQKNSKQNVKDSIQEDMNQDNDLSSNESTANETANKDSIEPKTDEEGSAAIDLNTELTTDEAEPDEADGEEKIDLVAQLQLDLANTKDTLLRKAAELENVRKRVQKERISLFEDARIQALKEIIPIAEDMNRTLEASASTKIDDNFLQGVQMVASKFKQLFERYGVEPINQAQVPFNVDFHDAMLRQPTEDPKITSNTVLQVLESGYKIGNRVIKHAKVIVSE